MSYIFKILFNSLAAFRNSPSHFVIIIIIITTTISSVWDCEDYFLCSHFNSILSGCFRSFITNFIFVYKICWQSTSFLASFLMRIAHNNVLSIFLELGEDLFSTLICATPLLLPVGCIHHSIKKHVRGETISVANFQPYKTSVFLKLCYIDHKTIFCALLPSWGEWQQKHRSELFWMSMRRSLSQSVSDLSH